MAGVNTVTKKLKELNIPVELVRGNGYHYFVYDDTSKNIYETESVMVSQFRSFSVDEWVQFGVNFSKMIEENY